MQLGAELWDKERNESGVFVVILLSGYLENNQPRKGI